MDTEPTGDAAPGAASPGAAPSADAPSGDGPPAGRSRRATRLHWVLVVLAAVLAAFAVLQFVETEGDVGPGRVSVGAAWGSSDTTIGVPPLGDVAFDTHRVPLAIQARIETIDPNEVQRLARDEDAVERFDDVAADDLQSVLVSWAQRALVAGLLAGAVAGALVWPRRVKPVLVGAASGVLAVVLLMGATWLTFSRTSLRNPQYRGALERAPEVLAAIDRNWGGIQEIPGRLQALAGNINELYTAVGDAGPTPGEVRPNETRILHISDVHSNPVGLELARGLATGFAVDAIIDTGDLTSFGLPVESRIGQLIATMPVPYYFVPGNHDTEANRVALDAYDNVTLLDGNEVTIGDVAVLGFADPAVTADGEDTDEEANDRRDAQAARIAARVGALEPDLLAVATLRQAAESFGEVPVVISGNTHKRSSRTEDGTRVFTVGSTGATGIGSFTEEGERSYEAQILHFRSGRLTAVDYVTFEGIDGDYTVSRKIIPRAPIPAP